MSVDVIIATYRAGGADAPLTGLARQTIRPRTVILVTEIGEAAVTGGFHGLPVLVVGHPYIPYHAPPHVFNAGLAHARSEYVAMLADFAYPAPDWIETLQAALNGFCAVGGLKCAHRQLPPVMPELAGPSRNRPLLPVQVASPLRQQNPLPVVPLNQYLNLGNVMFRREDAQAIGGVDERFSGDHGYEDENFVRRMVASTRCQIVVTDAVIHHFWPYAAGFKPLLPLDARPWALGLPNSDLDNILTESEILTGVLKGPSVGLVEVSPDRLRIRIASPAPEE